MTKDELVALASDPPSAAELDEIAMGVKAVLTRATTKWPRGLMRRLAERIHDEPEVLGDTMNDNLATMLGDITMMVVLLRMGRALEPESTIWPPEQVPPDHGDQLTLVPGPRRVQ
jgi:hypothetical protein